jgi:hypothetical protein
LNTVYFYWQSYHYTRQSYGIARAYRRAAGGAEGRDAWTDIVVLAFPIWGVLHRAAQHARRFAKGVEPSRPFLSWLSQPAHAGWYAAVCFSLPAVFYLVLGQTTSRLPQDVLPILLICHQAVNFHHYIVDAVIWRARRDGGAIRELDPGRSP